MRSDCHAVFSSMTVSPLSSTPYSDAVDRRRRHLRGPPTAAAAAKGPVSVGRIKRPMNAFMVWAQTERRRLSADNPGLHNVEISRRLGQKWLQMKEEERLPFMEEAERLRLLHLRQYPDYRYQPRKKTNSVVKVEEERGTTEGEEGKPTPAFQCTGRDWDEGHWKAQGPLNDSVRGYIDRWRQEEDGFWTPIPRNSSPNNTNQSMASSCSDYFISASVLRRQWPPTATPLGETLVPWPALPGSKAAFCPHYDLSPIHLPASVPLRPAFPCPSTDSPPDCLHRSLHGRDSAMEEGVPCPTNPSFAANATSVAADADCLLNTDPFISWLMNVYEVKELASSQSS